MTRVALLGCGKLGSIIAGALADGRVPGCELVGAMGRGMERAARLEERYGCKACGDSKEMLALRPDYLVEAATAQALRECAPEFLAHGCSVLCLSAGALADRDFYRTAWETAQAHGTKLYMASGVIGGFDIASALAVMGPMRGTLLKYKYPNASGRCPAALTELPDSFAGSAAEGFRLSPRHLNIAVSAGLVCGGLEQTGMRIVPIGGGPSPSFGVDMEGELARASVRVWQSGSGGEARGAELAAWSAVALLKRLTSPVTY